MDDATLLSYINHRIEKARITKQSTLAASYEIFIHYRQLKRIKDRYDASYIVDAIGMAQSYQTELNKFLKLADAVDRLGVPDNWGTYKDHQNLHN